MWPVATLSVQIRTCLPSQEVLLVMLSFFRNISSIPSQWEKVKVSVTQFCLTLWPHGLQPVRLLCPWGSPGKNTRMCSHSLLQGIFLSQGLNPGLLLCRQILYHLSHQGSLFITSTKDCSWGWKVECGFHCLPQAADRQFQSNSCQISKKWAWRNLRTQRSLSLFFHWMLKPSYDIASGLCLNTYLSDGECKVRQGSPAHHHTTEVFKLKQASLQSASAVLVQPSLTTRNLTPNSGESFLGLRMAEHILDSSSTCPFFQLVLYDLVCNLFPIMASFLSPSIHSRLSNKHYKIYFCEAYLTKNLTKSPTQPKWPVATVLVQIRTGILPKVLRTLEKWMINSLVWTLHCWWWGQDLVNISDSPVILPIQPVFRASQDPHFIHYIQSLLVSFIIWPCLPLPQWPPHLADSSQNKPLVSP